MKCRMSEWEKKGKKEGRNDRIREKGGRKVEEKTDLR